MNKKSTSQSAEPDLEDIEVPLLVEAIYRRWGYDFRDYAPASLKRRIRRIVGLEEVPSVSALQERVLRDPACMQRFLDQATVSVTSMFRDPGFYRAFRAVAVPLLKQRRALRIWDAGCASGEEVYSMAILLHEEGLLDRALIYATDINQAALDAAKEGIYPLEKMKEYTENYQASGGKAAFSEYYQAGHGHVVMRADLSKNIFWAQHNLVTDASFNEFDLILCRNVLIYFNRHLQERVHRLLYDSLMPDGLLVLGRQESLQLTPHETDCQALDSREKIYRRVR
ncbi:MAG: chemotaxis protein CheR [Gallionellales bacterium RIFCSPLOWO2_12_FULL_59_22]|nr:MAG: chemotaxis protein CheR [Gallionellales bacterium RIFCSPLOWO2_02_58_13]OGT11779.1 MAG: chemotaxis protein CheR [Gallionellales bacterium RIFCSPLOWO2_12_FULL_59_22]